MGFVLAPKEQPIPGPMVKRFRLFAWLVFIVLLAGALRFPGLAERPMHCDEAINADKSGTLLEQGSYQYDPHGFHGPTLNYLTLIPAWIQGAARYVDMNEVTLRSVPAVFGVLLAAAAWLLGPVVGFKSAAAAGILAALSPAMVYYSRYYIHESLFIFFSFGLLIGLCRYWENPSARWAIAAGISAGLMVATKETAIIAFASIAFACVFTRAYDRWHGQTSAGLKPESRPLFKILGIASGLTVSVLLLSSFFSHPRGVVDALLAYRNYFAMAGSDPLHIHPWHYYLGQISFFRDGAGPIWTEGLILLLAMVGFGAGMCRNTIEGANGRIVRFLGFYTLIMTGIYSAVPYKTPWCAMGFLHGMILLAGIGGIQVLQWIQRARIRLPVMVILAAALVHLGWEAWAAAFPYRSDPRNPYVYAHTGEDVFLIAGRIESLARAHANRLTMPVQIFTKVNLWPLPWYLRGLSGVRWSLAVPESVPSAPLILITPDMEPALARKLYELPPPGARELYMNIFDRPVWLRPGVEVRGYAAKTLWDEFRRQEAAAASQTGPELRK